MPTPFDRLADTLPALSHLECDQCRKRRDITKREAAAHVLNGGWPQCCGKTMRLVTEKEVRENRKE